MRQKPPNSIRNSIRYALLTLMFCAMCVVEVVHAKFALLTLSELHAYWLGREGHFPFAVLPWSERHFGGDTLAIRLPLLAVFALMLAVVLLGVNQLIKRQGPTVLVGGTLVLLALLAVQQYFSLKAVRSERHEFSLLMNRVERAAAPGEGVVAGWNLVPPLYAYGSGSLQQRLEGEVPDIGGVPPVANFRSEAQQGEFIFVGSENEPIAQRFAAQGFQFREDEMATAKETADIASYYRAARTGIYFVSPPARLTTGAVLSKP